MRRSSSAPSPCSVELPPARYKCVRDPRPRNSGTDSMLTLVLFTPFLPLQSLEWFAALLREDDEGDVADEFLEETRGTSVVGAQQLRRGALHTLLVTTKPRLAAWVRVVGGWPFGVETDMQSIAAVG